MHSSNTSQPHLCPQRTNTSSESYILPLPPPSPPPRLHPLPPPSAPTKRRSESSQCLRMSSNCTVTRLVRWRVKDLASCFYACRFPLAEETEGSSNVTSRKTNMSMVYDSRASNTEHETRRRTETIKKIREDSEKSGQSSSRNKCNVTPNEAKDGKSTSESNWPSFADEDYIVFCFRDDGGIRVINEGKPKEACDEVDEDKNKHTFRHFFSKEDEEETNEAQTHWPPDEIKETNPVEELSAHKMESSFESCDSNLSDTSTSSFAFPVLGVEWIGSPVQMPKSDKQRARNGHIHCCSF